MRWLLGILVLVGACTSEPPATFVDEYRTASYRFFYQPAVGDPISDQATLDQGPDLPTSCCFTARRWSTDTLDFIAGNDVEHFPTEGDCPGVAEAHISIHASGPGLVELSADTARMDLFYEQPDPEHCKHWLSLNDTTASMRGIELSGQVKLDELACLTDPDGISCAMDASGTFAIEGTIDKTLVFELDGSFGAHDTVAPL